MKTELAVADAATKPASADKVFNNDWFHAGDVGH